MFQLADDYERSYLELTVDDGVNAIHCAGWAPQRADLVQMSNDARQASATGEPMLDVVDCEDGYGTPLPMPEIRVTCENDGVLWRHIIGKTTTLREGERELEKGTRKEGSATCKLTVDDKLYVIRSRVDNGWIMRNTR